MIEVNLRIDNGECKMIDYYYVDLARNALTATIGNLVTTQNYLRDANLVSEQVDIEKLYDELVQLQKNLGKIQRVADDEQ